MRTLAVRFAAILVGAVVTGAVGCGTGGGELATGIVAKVGPRTISKAMLDHWTYIEGAVAHPAGPGGASATWVMPEPPAYKRCIAQLETGESKYSTRRKPAKSELKTQCQSEYHDLQQKVLGFLIQTMWMEGMAAEQGISLTDAELEEEYKRFTRREYPQPGELQRYLASTGMGASDELLRVRKNLLETRLNKKLERELSAVRGRGARERRLQLKLIVGTTGRWLAKTTCRAGYVVLFCRQYRGAQRL